MNSLTRFLFKTCPKSGRIVGVNQKNLFIKIVFPLFALAATIWFLIRVVPKPSRACYPCQQVAAPIALGFLAQVASLGAVAAFGRKAYRLLLDRRYWLGAALSLVVVAAFFGITSKLNSLNAEDGEDRLWVPTDGANVPMGVGRGIFPGRVVWDRDLAATPWDGVSGHWWDEGSIDQAVVDRMVERSVLALTGAKTSGEAWEKIFVFNNLRRDRGARGYGAGESIAIKINCNNAYDGHGDEDQQIDASKETVLALLRQLVNEAGVPQERILVYEAVRVIPDRIVDPCSEAFPGVLWMDSAGGPGTGRLPVEWSDAVLSYSGETKCGTGMPKRVAEADYLVNLALLKGHVSMGITLTAKNHFGTISERDHPWYLPGDYHPFVDLIGSKELGEKTVLFMVDGLFGIRDVNDDVGRKYAAWDKLFGGEWLASLFLSLDPVALDSVGYDFLRSEFGASLGRGSGAPADTYMHEAALADHPPSGVEYRPEGYVLESLGAHEHWNGFEQKQYSRNMDANAEGIELYPVHEHEGLGLSTVAR